MTQPSADDIERLWTKLDRRGDGECWPWLGRITQYGYGLFWVQGHYRHAHRVVYELLVGAIPDGLQIDHLCRVRSCVNPAHMEPVTQRENLLRGENTRLRLYRKRQRQGF